MDALDVRILETMGIYPYGEWHRPPERLRAPYIARKLKVAVGTVKARLARMEEVGIIAGYQVTPNFGHLGLKPTAYLMRGREDAEGLVVDGPMLEAEGVLEVHDFHAQGVCVLFAHAGEESLRRRLVLLRERTGDADPVLFHDWSLPRVERTLSPLDWRIIRALRWNAKAAPASVAEVVGVSARTVTRRLDRMVEEGSLAFTVLFDASKVSGLFPFVLALYFKKTRDAGTIRRILATFEGSRLHYDATASAELGHFAMILFAGSLAEVEALRDRARRIPGIRKAEPWFVRRQWAGPAWLDRLIEERARSDRTRAAGDVRIRQRR